MAHDIQSSGDRDFGYPPVPNVYANPVSTFRGLQGSALIENTQPEQSHYPYYGHYATASFTLSPYISPYASSYPDSVDENAPIQNAPVIPPTLLRDYSHLAPPTFPDHELSPLIAANIKLTKQKKSPRGATGDIVCEECGYKFIEKSSLKRHSKICRGKRASRKQFRAQAKSVKTRGVGFHSHDDNDTDAMSVTEIQCDQQDKKDQDAGYKGPLESISTANSMTESQGPSSASLTSNSTTPMSYHQGPRVTQPYVPRGLDTSEDHANFGCDLCPLVVGRRDILQMHKAQVHFMTESPFWPESGILNMPPYLEGVTLEKSSKHSRLALRIFHGGALSSSPCHPCMSRGLDCIVNPFVSSKCSLCAHHDNGAYCGAAGVKYRYVNSCALSLDSLR